MEGEDIGEYFKYYSEKRKRFYYVNKLTNESVWELPKGKSTWIL
jgi:hypothetical protein